jgi:hypothetical protein
MRWLSLILKERLADFAPLRVCPVQPARNGGQMEPIDTRLDSTQPEAAGGPTITMRPQRSVEC